MKKVIIGFILVVCSMQSFSQVLTSDTNSIKGSYYPTWRELYRLFLLVSTGQNLTASMQSSIDSIKSKVLFTQTASQTVAATTTKTGILGTGVGSLTVASSAIVAGKTYRIHMEGVYSTPILLNIANVTCRMELNGVAITTAQATTLLASASNSSFIADQLVTFRTVGATGTVVASGQLEFASSASSRAVIDMNTGITAVTVNTTGNVTFTPTVQWSNANAGNSVTSLICTFEQLN